MQVFVRSLLSGRTFCLSLNGQEDITAAHLKSVVAEREVRMSKRNRLGSADRIQKPCLLIRVELIVIY